MIAEMNASQADWLISNKILIAADISEEQRQRILKDLPVAKKESFFKLLKEEN